MSVNIASLSEQARELMMQHLILRIADEMSLIPAHNNDDEDHNNNVSRNESYSGYNIKYASLPRSVILPAQPLLLAVLSLSPFSEVATVVVLPMIIVVSVLRYRHRFFQREVTPTALRCFCMLLEKHGQYQGKEQGEQRGGRSL